MTMTAASSGADAGRGQKPAGFCTVPEDFHDAQARGLIGQLLRSFLDQSTITVIELLASAKNQKRLDGAGTLLRDSIERAAKMQAVSAQVPLGQRMRDLQNLVDVFMKTCWDRDQAETLTPLKPGEFIPACNQIKGSYDADQAKIRIFRLLTETLAASKMWYDKVGRLVELAAEAKGTAEFWYIDSMIGEAIMSDPAQESLLGRRSSIENRVEDLIALYKGSFQGRGSELMPVTARLNLLLLDQPMEETRAAIETTIVQQLAFKDNFCSPELLHELRGLHALLAKLKVGDKVLGGRRALEFIDKRTGRLVTQETISDYTRGAQNIGDRLTVLLDIYAVTFGPANRQLVEGFITRYFSDQDFERRLTQGEGSPQHKSKIITQLYRRLVAAPMGATDKAAFAGKLQRIQANLIAASKLFANIERQPASSAKKAQQIMALCLEHTFIPGENLDRARALIRHYLAKPDFLEKWVEGLPDRAAALGVLKKQLETLGIPCPFPI